MGTIHSNKLKCYDVFMSDDFIFSQTEYAKVLGISRECLRTRRRTGKLEGEYKVINGQYFYKRPRVNIEETTPKKPPIKRPRRGQHYKQLAGDAKTNYPNIAFQRHNEIKMLAALKSNVDPDEAALIPAAIHSIREDRKKQLATLQSQRRTNTMNYKNYGRGVYNCKKQMPKWVDYETYETNNVKPPKKYKYYDI